MDGARSLESLPFQTSPWSILDNLLLYPFELPK